MRVFQGIAVSPGYGEGRAFPYRRRDELFRAAANTRAQADSETELQRWEAACKAARLDLQALVSNLKENYALEEGEIFHSHFLILEDDLLTGLIRERIRKGHSAEAAVGESISKVEDMFRRQVNPYLRERSVDVRDVGARILQQLIDRQHHPFVRLPDAAVIVADEILPSDTVFLQRGQVQGIVTVHGSEDSHAAILSRAFGIPAVTGVAGILEACSPGDSISIDGQAGKVFLHIEGGAELAYARRARGYRAAVEEVRELRDCSVTLDGVGIGLHANVDREEAIDASVDHGAAGIGLLRTELVYLSEGGQPTEERQEEVYRYAARRMGDRPVNVRILDLAPDKGLPLSGDSPLAGAAIADCGLHFALAHPELLLPQVRAILRAADEGNLRILLPGITGIAEIEAFRRFLAEAQHAIHGQRGRRPRAVPVGAMIETPSALFMLKDIAEQTDFLSLGTNDLLRHLFGRERGRVQETVCEPSLLRAVDMAIRLAAQSGKELAICGEIAGDPAFTPLLVGLGLRTLSMSPQRLPEVRYNVSRLRASDAATLAHRALVLKTASDVDRCLHEQIDPWHQLVHTREKEAR